MNGIEITPVDVKTALRESLKLQSHYAGLLNQYDGGKRKTFDTVEDWVGRLIETGTLPISAQKENRLTADEASKLSKAANILEINTPDRIKEAQKLIRQVLYSAAPQIQNEERGTFTRTPPEFIDEDEW